MSGIKLSTAPPATTGMKTRNEEAFTTSLDVLPRVLFLLSFDDRNGETMPVSQTLQLFAGFSVAEEGRTAFCVH